MPSRKKVLIISASDHGGAGDAMYKLFKICQELTCDVEMVVRDKTNADDDIIPYSNYKSSAQKFFSKVYSKFFTSKPLKLDPNYYFFDVDEVKPKIDAKALLNQLKFTPDYIFTGFTSGFTNSTDLYNLQKLTNAQVYNVTVDMNHFTGGCHYAWDCLGYINGCDANCPALLNPKKKKIARINFHKKLENAKKGNFKIVAGSGLTLAQAKQSKIYKKQAEVLNINSLIDVKIYNAKKRSIAKEVFEIDSDKFVILCGSQNYNEKRKGFEYMIDALKILENRLDATILNKIEILVVSNQPNSLFEGINISKKYIPYIKDHRLLSVLYQATDLYVNSSIEDSGPMMVSEALACGTLVVGFNTGVVTNMVINDYNGYKVENKNADQLAHGIKKVIELSAQQRNEFSKNAVKQVEDFSSFEYVKTVIQKLIQ